MKFLIKKGDTVQVITGSEKGKRGRVLRVDKKKMRVTLEGLNMQKHHEKPRGSTPGGIISREGPIHYSNVLLVDKNGKPTRLGRASSLKEGLTTRVRIARTTGEEV